MKDLNQIEVLQLAPFTELGNKRLAEVFKVTALWEQPNPEKFLGETNTDFSAVVTTGKGSVSLELLEELPGLKIVATRGVGYDHIDLDAAKSKNIIVTNTPGVVTDCVADLAFGAVIGIARKLAFSDRFVRNGFWKEKLFPLGNRISGKNLGIIGLGRIGQAIAKRAAGFSMGIRYYDRSPNENAPWEYESSLLNLAKWSDFLILCIPGGENTKKLISWEILDALGPKGFLINVARGSVVDEQALISALNEGKIAGAALDVFENEPDVPFQFLDMDNVLLFPHIGSSTEETRNDMEDLVVANLRSFFQNDCALTMV